MKKILAFGASNSKASINHQLAIWAANQIEEVEVIEVRLDDYEMPLYSIDKENENGIPALARDFKNLVNESDGIIVSFAEHNGSYSVAFKNIYDWISRIGKPIWGDKPMMLLATSPGPRGGVTILNNAQEILPHRGAIVSGVFSLPSFGTNFSDGIVGEELIKKFQTQLDLFENSIMRGEKTLV